MGDDTPAIGGHDQRGTASAAPGNIGFGFNATDISGFPTGAASLTGGGSYNPGTGFVNSAGGFRCTSKVGQGPLAGCLSGEGVRWDTVELLPSTTFKCTGSAAEPLKIASTDENTVVLLADFYRAGDGNDESFTAQMIVSADDIAPDVAGIQDVWMTEQGHRVRVLTRSGTEQEILHRTAKPQAWGGACRSVGVAP